MIVRVAVAEDDVLVRQGIEAVVASATDLELVASAGDLDAALQAMEASQADVLVTDIKMPPTMTDEGIRLATEIGRRHPGTGVVVLNQYDDPDYVLSLLGEGTRGRHSTIGPDQSFPIMAGGYKAVGYVPIRRLDYGTSGIEPNVSREVVGALVVSALFPREHSKMEVARRIVWVKVDQSLRNRLLLCSHLPVIQSVPPVFHHHRLSR